MQRNYEIYLLETSGNAATLTKEINTLLGTVIQNCVPRAWTASHFQVRGYGILTSYALASSPLSYPQIL